MKHKFIDFTNAIRDFGEKLVLQFIGFAQNNSKLIFSTKYSDPLWIYSYFARNLYVGGWIWKPNINRAQLLDLHSFYHVILHTHNQHLISLCSNIWNSYKISHLSVQNIGTFNVIWKAETNKFEYKKHNNNKKRNPCKFTKFLLNMETIPRLPKIFCKNKLSQKCSSVTE